MRELLKEENKELLEAAFQIQKRTLFSNSKKQDGSSEFALIDHNPINPMGDFRLGRTIK